MCCSGRARRDQELTAGRPAPLRSVWLPGHRAARTRPGASRRPRAGRPPRRPREQVLERRAKQAAGVSGGLGLLLDWLGDQPGRHLAGTLAWPAGLTPPGLAGEQLAATWLQVTGPSPDAGASRHAGCRAATVVCAGRRAAVAGLAGPGRGPAALLPATWRWPVTPAGFARLRRSATLPRASRRRPRGQVLYRATLDRGSQGRDPTRSHSRRRPGAARCPGRASLAAPGVGRTLVYRLLHDMGVSAPGAPPAAGAAHPRASARPRR